MIKKVDLNKLGLKSFLYNFFIVWNLLLIVLLIFLNIYLPSLKTEKKNKEDKVPKEWGQFKLNWKSDYKYQDIGKNISSIAFADVNEDKVRDIILLSSDGMLSALNGKNGYSIFKVKFSKIVSVFNLINDNIFRIILGTDDGKILLISTRGKVVWEVNTGNKSITSGFYYANKKLNVVAVFKNAVALFDGRTGKILGANDRFGNSLLPTLLTYDFNKDGIDDFIVGDITDIFCVDGKTSNILWSRKFSYIWSGKCSLLMNGYDTYLVVPFYNGKVKILNQAGKDVWEFETDERVVSSPVVMKDKQKHTIIIQSTLAGKLVCADFSKRKIIWQKGALTNSPVKIGLSDFNYDNVPELVVSDKFGHISILKVDSGKLIDSLTIFENKTDEYIESNIIIDDIDNDGDLEIGLASNSGSVYIYTYKILKKRKFLDFLFKKVYRWSMYGGNYRRTFTAE